MDSGEVPAPMIDEGRAPYSSAVRSSQARATRRAIVTAAAELFVAHGYAATTIDAVAARAGVGRKTVFSSVGGKGALLKLALDWAVVGDDEPTPMAERPAVREMLAERDPVRLVRMWVDMQVEVGSRATPIGAVIIAAADVDADARALSAMIRRESLAGATAFVTHLAGVGGLRAGLTVERGAEACWALVNAMLLDLLVRKRHWSLVEFGDWLFRVAAATLLEAPVAATARARPLIRIVNDEAANRYEAMLGDRLAGHLAYERTERMLVLLDTQVDPRYDGAGVADALVRVALDDVGTRRVAAVCPYVTWWISGHPAHPAMRCDPATG